MDLRIVILVIWDLWDTGDILEVNVCRSEMAAVNHALSTLCDMHDERHLLPENFREKSAELIDYLDKESGFYFSITVKKNFV